MFGIIGLLSIIASYFLFKRKAFKIMSCGLLIFVFMVSFTLSRRYMKPQIFSYHKNGLTYSQLKKDPNFRIYTESEYPINEIPNLIVPEAILSIGYLQNECNSKDTILTIEVMSKIYLHKYWFLKKAGNEEASKLIFRN